VFEIPLLLSPGLGSDKAFGVCFTQIGTELLQLLFLVLDGGCQFEVGVFERREFTVAFVDEFEVLFEVAL